MVRAKLAAVAAAACAVGAAGCVSPPAQGTGGFRSPRVFEAAVVLKGEERTRQAANWLALFARERGSTDQPAPPELAALGPKIIQALRADGFEPSFTLALGILGTGMCLEYLLERAQAEAPGEAAELGAVARALAMIRDPAAIQAVRRLCRHPDADVRVEAMTAAAGTADEGMAGVLADGLQDEVVRVRWSAALALALQRGSGAGRAVLHRMLDRRHVEEHTPAGPPDRAARISRTIRLAAAALVALRDETAIEPLQTASLDDVDEGVRRACRDAMEALLIPPASEPGRIHGGQ